MKKRILLAAALLVFTGIAGLALIFGLPSSTTGRQNESNAQNLRNAIKQFHLQYSVYPLSQSTDSKDLSTDTTKPFMDVILGTNATANPRMIAFGEWRDATKHKNGIIQDTRSPQFGSLVDAWGNPYRVVVDANGDNLITNPDPSSANSSLRQTTLVYSAGPDGDYTTWHDNIKTW